MATFVYKPCLGVCCLFVHLCIVTRKSTKKWLKLVIKKEVAQSALKLIKVIVTEDSSFLGNPVKIYGKIDRQIEI